MARPLLHLDWVDARAARFACERWHYSGCLPAGKLVKCGVWENGQYIGVVLFGRGASPQIGAPFGLKQTEVCELVRVALAEHVTPTSRIVAIAMRMLRKQSPGLRLIVSFADSAQGHHGGIYQAGGWMYLGAFEHHCYRVHGQTVHPKTLHSRYGKGGQSVPWLRAHVDPNAERLVTAVKHKYVMPLADDLRRQLTPQCKRYPKRARSTDSGVSADQVEGGGATPTRALLNEQAA